MCKDGIIMWVEVQMSINLHEILGKMCLLNFF